MFDFDILRLVPKFILKDRNGYAIAKAIEAGMAYYLDRLQGGIDVLLDVSSMPEWRLDEMAWELGCPYDYNGAVENKRKWIVNALPYYSIIGTPQSIINYLEGHFDSISVIPGAPFHFTINLSGDLDAEKEAWLKYAIETVKNVRSIYDGMTMTSYTPDIQLANQEYKLYSVPLKMCGTFNSGTDEL